jgi:hypothetical protein
LQAQAHCLSRDQECGITGLKQPQFSFLLPDTLSSNPTTQVTDFSYSLNGTTVSTSLPGGALFYSVANGGGFDLYPTINNGSNVSVLSFLFPNDVGSNLKVVGGTFQTSIELNDGITTADGLTPGSGSGMVTIASATTPEPSCWGQRSCLVPASFVSVARPTG